MSGAKRLIRVQAEQIFPNCPRFIPNMVETAPSIYTPSEANAPPEPPWKQRAFVRNVFDAEKQD